MASPPRTTSATPRSDGAPATPSWFAAAFAELEQDVFSPTRLAKEREALQEDPRAAAAATWLWQRGVPIEEEVLRAHSALRRRKRYLHEDGWKRYRQRVVIGRFLVTWVIAVHGRSWKTIVQQQPADIEAFETVFLAFVDDPRLFRTTLRRLSRPTTLKHFNIAVDNFDGFLQDATAHQHEIAERFVQAFSPKCPEVASTAAVRYLFSIAVSRFLWRTGMSAGRGPNGVLDYFDGSRRLSRRLMIAFKAAYLPETLTKDDVSYVRETYNQALPFGRRQKIKHIATVLGFGTGPRLSKRLHKLRLWFDSRTRKLADAFSDTLGDDWDFDIEED